MIVSQIHGKDRYTAESILRENGFSYAEAAEIVAMHCGCRTQTIVGNPADIRQTIDRYYYKKS